MRLEQRAWLHRMQRLSYLSRSYHTALERENAIACVPGEERDTEESSTLERMIVM
jgi:hypothetical protein